MNTPIRRRALATSLSLLSLASHAQQTAPLKTQVATRVDAMYPWLDGIHKDLHAHPETADQTSSSVMPVAGMAQANPPGVSCRA